jgi:hypothetical protein
MGLKIATRWPMPTRIETIVSSEHSLYVVPLSLDNDNQSQLTCQCLLKYEFDCFMAFVSIHRE